MSEHNLAHQCLGRYQLLVAIARGGMGQVWLARLQGARGFNKVVAIKTLLPDEADRARLESMLAEEARLASLIQHANVVHTLELGEHEGLLYLVMEWVDGEPLGFLQTKAAEQGGMPLGIAAQLVSQVLAGLHAAHELSDDTGPLGVVHRDVSPHNILVTYDGVAKLLDFGIAKATHQTTGDTDSGEVKGKFSYMAPEQILGEDVDCRCDVFAAGIVLYSLTTGRHPFKRHNTAAVIHAITGESAVAPPSSFVEDFPPELERVLLRALEKNREKRFASAEAMRVALEQAMPEAFTDTGRFELRAFMERTAGDRKIARREGVRRAQLAADSRDLETGSRRALQGGAQSVSSLRAISISQPAPEAGPEPLGAASSTPPTHLARQAAPKPTPTPTPTPKAPWLAAAAGVLLAMGAVAPRFSGPEGAPGAATTGVRSGATLLASETPTPAPTPLQLAPVELGSAAAPAASVAPPANADADPRAKPLTGATSADVAPSAAPAAKPTPPRGTARPKAKPAQKAPGKVATGAADLLTPDYAR